MPENVHFSLILWLCLVPVGCAMQKYICCRCRYEPTNQPSNLNESLDWMSGQHILAKFSSVLLMLPIADNYQLLFVHMSSIVVPIFGFEHYYTTYYFHLNIYCWNNICAQCLGDFLSLSCIIFVCGVVCFYSIQCGAVNCVSIVLYHILSFVNNKIESFTT